jgi:LmbE family N-acetylglucosaminyl deacetylase
MKRRVLILAPHPDDECIVGLLPLRLQEECGYQVWAVPVTLGSHSNRRSARKREMRAACSVLGFRLRWISPGDAESELCGLLKSMAPAVVFLPHAKDGHPTHRLVHRLGTAAMDASGHDFHVVETEYWHPLERPNLMVAASKAHLARLRRALACHQGEIARNDYAARLPAWMSDNVRRGAELIAGPGSPAPDFTYATLYRARNRSGGSWRPEFRASRIVDSSADLINVADLWA